jgi:molecular chaperone HscB
MNYFELFEIPVAIKINQPLLNQKYFELQRRYHPDFFTQSTDDEQTDALEMSSQINKALKIFKNEDDTIKYILLQKNILTEDEKYQLPPDFLMEMMDLNEELSVQSIPEINDIQHKIYAEVNGVINNYSDEKITTANLLQLKAYYFKKKYLQRILERLDG